MTKTILVPLDGSELSERALPYARRVARSTGARIILLRAVPAEEAASQEAVGSTDLSATLRQQVDELQAEGLEATAVVENAYFDDLGDVIVATAVAQQADLIVMSTHGRGGLGRWIYGSVADQVLRRAPVSLLLIPATCRQAPSTQEPTRILVALDGSPLAEQVLVPAADLARGMGAELCLLRVVEFPTYAYAEGYAYGSFDQLGEEAESRTYLEGIAERLRNTGSSVPLQVETGHVGSVIVRQAQEQGVDWIALATHGRGGLARLALGSVATSLVQRAGLPLLVVRPTQADEAAPPPIETVAESVPIEPSVELTFDPDELTLLERGLGVFLYSPERDWNLATPARRLLARLHGVEPVRPPRKTITVI